MRPSTLADVAARASVTLDWQHHLDEFLDSFYGMDGDRARQAAAIADAPGLLGVARADAFLGGVGEHLARRWGLRIPGWVTSDERYLKEAFYVPDRKAFRGYLLAVSPVAFRTRLIFTGPDPLQRARFPYGRGVVSMPLDRFEPSARLPDAS
jgi:hypothetical protein